MGQGAILPDLGGGVWTIHARVPPGPPLHPNILQAVHAPHQLEIEDPARVLNQKAKLRLSRREGCSTIE
jgi:hypothetical protein